MAANPSARFFWNDWENDPALRMCSLAAQGLWMRMLCLAAKADPVGHVKVGDQPCTVADLSMLTGAREETVTALLDELARSAVYSLTRDGTIYSRRLARDAKRAKINRKNGLKGGAAKHLKNNKDFGVGNRIPSEPPSDHPSPTTSSKLPISIKKEILWSGRLLSIERQQFEDWVKNLPTLGPPGIRRELMKADAYYSEKPPKGHWFFPVVNWLAKAEADAAKDKRADNINESW